MVLSIPFPLTPISDMKEEIGGGVEKPGGGFGPQTHRRFNGLRAVGTGYVPQNMYILYSEVHFVPTARRPSNRLSVCGLSSYTSYVLCMFKRRYVLE